MGGSSQRDEGASTLGNTGQRDLGRRVLGLQPENGRIGVRVHGLSVRHSPWHDAAYAARCDERHAPGSKGDVPDQKVPRDFVKDGSS